VPRRFLTLSHKLNQTPEPLSQAADAFVPIETIG